MTKTIGPREQMLRQQREQRAAGVFKGRDGKDLIGNAKKRARQAFAAAQAAIAAAPPLKTKENKMDPTTAIAPQAEPQAMPPKAAGKAKGAKKAPKAPKVPGKAKKRASKPAKAKAARPAKAATRKGSKVEIVAKLLQRPEGTTTKEVLAKTGWPAVSMPQQAKAAGLKLRKVKTKGEPTRYFGAAA